MTVAPYEASPIKRRRATSAEMAARAAFLVDYAAANAPVTVRQLFYAATVAGVPGIAKTESGYAAVQRQVLELRRQGLLPYSAIADSTRFMRKPNSHDGWEAALHTTAHAYRKALWADSPWRPEIWCEKSALAGVLFPATAEYDAPLMCTGGFSSETFAFEAVASLQGSGRGLHAFALYDFDRAGRDACASLEEKVFRFGAELDVPVAFEPLALSAEQVAAWNLPTREPKRKSAADRTWPYPVAAELDAIPPNLLRTIVRAAIERHLPRCELAALKRTEEIERATLINLLEEPNEPVPLLL